MSSRKRLALLFVALAVLVVWFQVILFCPPITGRVVDVNGRPIAAAVVVTDWSVHAPLSNAPIGQLRMFEVVTDGDGRFRVPGWGLEAVGRGLAQAPVVRIFHPDYAPLVLEDVYHTRLGLLVPVFPRNGETFVLERASPEAMARGNSFARLYRSLFSLSSNVTVGGNCPMLSMPRMLAAMEKAPFNIIDGDIPGSPVIAFRARDVETRVPCHFKGG